MKTRHIYLKMSENKIKCPECGTLIDIDEALSHQAEERLNEKMRLKELNRTLKITCFM